LQYLMGVRRDPDIRLELRIRVARTVVPFVHPKQKQDPRADQTDAELVNALGDEFMVDPALAAKVRDDEFRLKDVSYRLNCRGSRGPPTPAEIEEKTALGARTEEAASAIGFRQGMGRSSRLPTECSQIVCLQSAP
jgi:hypothetical protein